MANVFRRLYTMENLTVDLVWSDVGVNNDGLAPFDVIGVRSFNPDGLRAALTLTNAVGQKLGPTKVPLTAPGVPFDLQAPSALQMVEQVNWRGATVLTLSQGATIGLETGATFAKQAP